MADRPFARTDLVVESVDDERVVYVAETQEAHCLDHAAASVWDACDGTRTATDIGRRLGRDVASVDATLARLAYRGLLTASSLRTDERGDEFNRRTLLRRGAVAGAAMTAGVGTILTVDVPSALATMSHVQTLVLYRTPSSTCVQTITTDTRGSVVVTVSGVPGNPALDKLTLVVTLTAYSSGLPPEIFDIAINCGVPFGTIIIGPTGAAGPVTVTTTVPHNQASVVTVTPTVPVIGTFTFFTKATPSFVG